MQTIRVGIMKVIDERERERDLKPTVLQWDEVIAKCN